MIEDLDETLTGNPDGITAPLPRVERMRLARWAFAATIAVGALAAAAVVADLQRRYGR